MIKKIDIIGMLTTVILAYVNIILMLTMGKEYEVVGTIINAVFCLIGVVNTIRFIRKDELWLAIISGIVAGLTIAFYIPYVLAVNNKITHATYDWQLGIFLFFITVLLCLFAYCFYREHNGRFSGEQYKLYPFLALPVLIIVNSMFFAGDSDMRIAYFIVMAGSLIVMLCSIYFAWCDMQRIFIIVPCTIIVAVVLISVVALQRPVPVHEHIYVSETTMEPSCVKEGERKYFCVECDNTYVEPIEVVEHKYKEGVRAESTCTTEGTVTYNCEVCDANYSEPLAIAEHTYSETARVEASCTTEGSITYACQVCGFSTNETIPLSGNHSYSVASYVKGGLFKTGRENLTCVYCGEKYTQVLVGYSVIKILIWVIIAVIAIFVIKEIVDDAYRWWIIKTRPGFWIFSLVLIVALFYIGFYLVIKFVPKEGATWYDKVLVDDYNDNEHIVEEVSRVEATCTTEGNIVLGCRVCDDTYEEIIPKKAHSNVETARTHATCTAKGNVTYVCSVCGYNHTEELEMLPHTYIKEKIEPTCSVHGANKYTCSVCLDSYHEKIPVLEHKNVEQSRTEGTFLKCGVINYKCELCGEVTDKKIVQNPGWKVGTLSVLLLVDIITFFTSLNLYPRRKKRTRITICSIAGIVMLVLLIYYLFAL